MFDFIGNILERITNFFAQFLLLIIILLAVVLLFLATYRKNHNPYIDHTKDQVEQQIDSEREAKYREALQRLYDEQYGK
ncbi:hypothetical protein [Fibrobacter sp.]|uniref:hypothetical protein n=1 Tax=Fibrobacter sp. TaxID=35828 RepID=UPI0038901234